MNLGFWEKFPPKADPPSEEKNRSIMIAAPMANVTDAAFRRMFLDCGRPDVFWTEFVSVEGLLSAGKKKLLVDFWYDKAEHPIVAQIFGAKPEQFRKVAEMIGELGFDGIDINMGCPDKAVEKQGGGAALMKNINLAKEIIRATKLGGGGLPVSVKTRIGYNKNEIATWITALLEESLAAITVHLRTRKEMSDVPAHWELGPSIIELRNRYSPETLILGNGDLKTLEEAHAKVSEAGLDGAMIGRGVFGNPWFFSGRTPTMLERLTKLIEHTELFEKMFDKIKPFDIMKKHFKAYTTGFVGAKELRVLLMKTETAAEVKKITEEFLKTI